MVDDQRDNAEPLADFLGDRGYDVTISTNAQQACHLLESNHFDVVVMDIWLKSPAGPLVRTIRCLWPDTKIILLSGECPHVIQKYKDEWGADDGVEKDGEEGENIDSLIQSLCPNLATKN